MLTQVLLQSPSYVKLACKLSSLHTHLVWPCQKQHVLLCDSITISQVVGNNSSYTVSSLYNYRKITCHGIVNHITPMMQQAIVFWSQMLLALKEASECKSLTEQIMKIKITWRGEKYSIRTNRDPCMTTNLFYCCHAVCKTDFKGAFCFEWQHKLQRKCKSDFQY